MAPLVLVILGDVGSRRDSGGDGVSFKGVLGMQG